MSGSWGWYGQTTVSSSLEMKGHGMLMLAVCPTGPEDRRKAVEGWGPELEGIPA